MREEKQRKQLEFMKKFCEAKFRSFEARIRKPIAEVAVLTDLLLNSRRSLDGTGKKFEAAKIETKQDQSSQKYADEI